MPARAKSISKRPCNCGSANPCRQPRPCPSWPSWLTAPRNAATSSAGRFWRQLEGYAVAALEKPPAEFGLKERIPCAWKLAEAYRFQQQPERAIACLTPLLASHDQLDDPAGKRSTLQMLAAHHNSRQEHEQAVAYLREGLDLPTRTQAKDRIARADLWNDLAETYQRLHRPADVERCRDQSAELYRAALSEPRADRGTIARTTTAFWKLQRLYQKREQRSRALDLIEEQALLWDRSTWMGARLQGEKGSMQLLLGSYEKARQALSEAVRVLEAQEPVNLIDLPRALLGLGIVEQGSGAVARAETLGHRCLALYRKHSLPDDLTLVETRNLLGTCLALRGEYAQAIEQFRPAADCCEKLGPAANAQHSNLLLNWALVHKAQGDLEEALRYCLRARELCRSFADSGSLELASLHAALADLQAARGRYREAADLADTVLQLCQKHQVASGFLVVTARHCQALHHLYRREFGPAEKGWQAILALLEKEQQTLLIPRTLNFLGVTAEMQGQLTTAEQYYRRALSLQQGNTRAFPATHFISLWRLANLAERQGRLSEALTLLEQGMPLVEEVRSRTYGDAQQRSAFFAQFAPAFEQLVEWNIRAGRLEEAFTWAARTRSRTLLDQLQMTGVDPRQGLSGPQGRELLQQEKLLREQMGAIRARAMLLSATEDSREEASKLSTSLEQVQQRYAEVWREILNRNPVYRSLAGFEQPGRPTADLLTAIRDKVLGPRNLLLVYYLGRERSHLLLLGQKDRPIEVFSLEVPADLLHSLASLASSGNSNSSGKRGIRVKPVPVVPAPLRTTRAGVTLPLTQERARYLIDLYRQQLEDPDFQPTRGIKVVPRERVPASGARQAGPLPDADSLGNVFLPAEVRERIKQSAPDHVLVVPDRALHKMPLEALPLAGGAKPRYLLDELPPLIYSPSSAVLALLADRPRRAPSVSPGKAGPLSLLTLSNPAYPQPTGKTEVAAPAAGSLLGLRGQLALLPATAEESRAIQRLFAPGEVLALEGAAATEQAVVRALARQPRIVHLAAHGLADDRLGNLFGALALTPPPPGQERSDNDGFLSLHEICALPLTQCDLAVLSACDTNAGPQRPLEAGVTLSFAFLAAGARYSVASHWSVDDRSTAELMNVFFAEVTAGMARPEGVSYAQALRKACLKIRNQSKWATPFYWAPFVLVGPPEPGPVAVRQPLPGEPKRK